MSCSKCKWWFDCYLDNGETVVPHDRMTDGYGRVPFNQITIILFTNSLSQVLVAERTIDTHACMAKFERADPEMIDEQQDFVFTGKSHEIF